MSWEDNVIGGIGNPRALVTDGYDRIANGSFEDNISNWTSSNLDIIRKVDVTAPHGNIVLSINDSGASQGYTYTQMSLGEAIGGKTFVVTFYAKDGRGSLVSHDAQIVLESALGQVQSTKEFTVLGTGWTRVTHVYTFSPSDTNQYLYLVLFARTAAETTYETLYDKIEVYEVEGDYTLNIPNVYDMSFKKVLNYQNETIDGGIKESIKGWRFMANLDYQFIEPNDVKTLVAVSEAPNLIFLPHDDFLFSVNCTWDSEFKLSYFHNRYVGHNIPFTLKALELVQNKPRQTSTEETTTLRVERTEIIY